MVKAKTDYTASPALAFIKPAAEQEQATSAPASLTSRKAPEGMKVNPYYIEKRTRRVQLVLQPSLYEKAKAASEALGLSFNDYVHALLEQALTDSAE
jgi:predicted DNA binding CopG/RHH family protein